MEIEIFWETQPELPNDELHQLSEVALNLATMVKTPDFFGTNFFIKEQLPEPLNLNIIFTDDAQIRTLNSTYRDKDAATDVLTFPFDPAGSAEDDDSFITPPSEEFPSYAEIYISQDTALRQSREQNLTLLQEFIILIVHGLLHAFGYDHEKSEEDKKQMSSLEREVLTRLGLGAISLLER